MALPRLSPDPPGRLGPRNCGAALDLCDLRPAGHGLGSRPPKEAWGKAPKEMGAVWEGEARERRGTSGVLLSLLPSWRGLAVGKDSVPRGSQPLSGFLLGSSRALGHGSVYVLGEGA